MQSWVAFGHVGNAAAIFPLQRLGAEVLAIHTVQFSNHTGYGDWTGQVFTGDHLHDLARGLAARGALSLDAVLSGYLGDAGVGRAILDIVAQARAASPAMLYCCDPVMGDTGRGLFVRPDIPPLLLDHAAPAADIMTPNQFELEQMTGISCHSRAELLRAISSLQDRMRRDGPRLVLVTSVRTGETADDAVELVAASPEASFLLKTPRLPLNANGAGDLIAALFLFHVASGDRSGAALRHALECAGSATWAVLARTASAGSAELCLVAAQDEIVSPTSRYDARSL